MSDQNRVAVGEINSPWGIKGHVKVTPLTSNPERLQPKQQVFVGDLALTITDAKIVGKIPVVQFSSFTTRNSVESLKGSLIEILEKDNDIIGDDVNITARIEPFSAPGGIAISNKVNDALVRESDFKTKYLGKPKLKGVGQIVEVYCIISHNLPETKLSTVSAKLEKESNYLYSVVASSLIILFGIY